MNILLPTMLKQLSEYGRPMYAEEEQARAICTEMVRLKLVRAKATFKGRTKVNYQITAAGRRAARSRK